MARVRFDFPDLAFTTVKGQGNKELGGCRGRPSIQFRPTTEIDLDPSGSNTIIGRVWTLGCYFARYLGTFGMAPINGFGLSRSVFHLERDYCSARRSIGHPQ